MVKSPKVEKAEKASKKIGRNESANLVVATITGKTTLLELAAKADQLVVDGGGESDLKLSARSVRRSLETMEAAGLLRLTKPSDILIEKTK